jgi:hypothetical protein
MGAAVVIVGAELDRLLQSDEAGSSYLVPLPAGWHRCRRCGMAVHLRDQCCRMPVR